MTLELRQTRRLSTEQAAEVARLARLCTEHDGVSPLNEAAGLALSHPDGSTLHLLARQDGRLVGYAQLDANGGVQLFVEPAERRQGVGSLLADRAAGREPEHWWAFGWLPAARGFARRRGLVVVRSLLIMRRTLGDELPALPMPTGITLDHFRPEDCDELVRVNAAAFAHHPEQGAMDRAQAAERMSQDWFSAEDLLVARDLRGGLAGFHWIKITEQEGRVEGEVYVIGVDPAWAGRGLGRSLLRAGLVHMRERGADLALLYVESDNSTAVRLYESANFEVITTDVALAAS